MLRRHHHLHLHPLPCLLLQLLHLLLKPGGWYDRSETQRHPPRGQLLGDRLLIPEAELARCPAFKQLMQAPRTLPPTSPPPHDHHHHHRSTSSPLAPFLWHAGVGSLCAAATMSGTIG